MGVKVLLEGVCGEGANSLCTALGVRGYSPAVARDDVEQIAGSFDAVLVFGSDLVERCHRLVPRARARSVVVVDATPDVDRTVAVLRAGAADYVTDPEDIDGIDEALRRVLDRQSLKERLDRLGANENDTEGSLAVLHGESLPMRRVRATLERLRESDSTVLISGESGTGKEVTARYLHRSGRRQRGPFIAVSCAALPAHLVESEFFGYTRGAFTGAACARRGLLVEASGGTLFLDEVSAMPLPTQAKLLRAIQQRTVRPLGNGAEVPFDARIVAASNVDLEGAVANGTFREDLFFRLNVVQIKLPPLRERGPDRLLLGHHFILQFARASHKRVLGMTSGAARALLAYDFPGNVRELQNAMEAAVALTRHDHVTETELVANLHPSASSEALGDDETLASWDALEARHIARVLEEVNGNKAEAARLLGIDRKTLYRKLRRHGLGGSLE